MRGRTASNSREMVVPEPLHRLLASVDADVLMAPSDVRVAFLGCGSVVPLDPTGADYQDVAGVELDTLVFCDFVQVFDEDLVS